jgi:tripartite-type tricarboxylate transporter receptor subunit TctC
MLESTVRSVFMSEYKSGDLKIFVQFGPKRAVPFFGSATRLYDRARNEQDRLTFDVIFKQAELSRPFAAPPGVPLDRISILRKAMIETSRDPQLIADAAKVSIEYNPVPGEETHDIFASYASIPAETIKAARDLIEPE